MDERARTGGFVPIAGGLIDLRIVPLYIEGVIQSFQHKGIESFFKTGSKAGIQPRHEHLQLGALDAAVGPDEMNFPGWKLHPLKGELAGHWAVRIDTEMALRLGQWLGTGPEVWLNMQSAYDLWQAEQRPRPRIERLAVRS